MKSNGCSNLTQSFLASIHRKELMKKLHIVSILDRSGSMGGSESEVIGAYNSFIQEQRKILKNKSVEGKLTTVLFDDKYEILYDKVSIDEVEDLTSQQYFVRGMTALFDAIGKTINRLEGKKNVIFFIETDGYENSSQEFSAGKIKDLVEEKTKEGWDFNFVGAGLDAMTTSSIASSISIDANKTMVFNKSQAGYATRNTAFADATTAYIDENN